jgi:hypothetical protein
MRDRFFFPLAAVVAGGFIFTAVQPFAYRAPTGPVSGGGRNAEDVTVAGEELHRFLPGNYDGIAIVTPSGGGAPVVRITRLGSEIYEKPQSGPHIMLDADLEYALESRPIEVEMVARSAGDFAASKFEADYYARDEGESGWCPFVLTPEWQTYRFQFTTPKRSTDREGYDYIGVRPDVPDAKRRIMELKSIRIHAIGPKIQGEVDSKATCTR